LPLLLSKPFFTPKSQAIVLMVITFALVWTRIWALDLTIAPRISDELQR
jgi:hypothetical protein